jgi:hypothetical protein
VPVSAVDIISPAFERMKRLLFGPFRFGQWVRFAVVGFLAGEMGGGGGCSTNLPFNPSQSDPFPAPTFPGSGPLAIMAIGLLIVIGFALLIVWLYVNSRMRFVLFDSVIAGECRIRESWSRRGTPAFRYFVWQILILLAALIGLCVLIGFPLLAAFGMGWFRNPREHLLALVLGGAFFILMLLAWFVVLAFVNVLTKDFVVPQMALGDLSASEGWSRLWPMMKAEKGPYALYLVMKLLLALAAGVIFGLLTISVILLILIPVGGIGVLTVLGGRAAGLTWNPITIAIAIVVAGVILLALFFIGSLISVPSIVFFPAYSLYFFADRYPPLNALLFPPVPPPGPPLRDTT